jgi:hypothetical protein
MSLSILKPTPENVQRILIYLMRISIIIVMIGEIIEQRWGLLFVSTLVLLSTYLPKMFEKRYNVNLPLELEVLVIAFVYAAFFLGEMNDFYHRYWWWDIMLHTVSGIVLAYIGFIILYVLNSNNKIKANAFWLAFFAFCFATAAAGVWEIFEFAMDELWGWDMQRRATGVVNTMWDLIVATAGALIISIIGYFYLRKQNKSLFGKMLDRFIDHNKHLESSKHK